MSFSMIPKILKKKIGPGSFLLTKTRAPIIHITHKQTRNPAQDSCTTSSILIHQKHR